MRTAAIFLTRSWLNLITPARAKLTCRILICTQSPGTYHVDILLNDQWLESRDVTFSATRNAEGNEQLEPCLSVEQLALWGVKTTLFPALGSDNKTCANIQVIPQASVDFQFSQQRLVLSIPQAALSGQARGYVPPEQWDDGITAAMLNYSLSGANSWGRNGSSSDAHSQYANLRPDKRRAVAIAKLLYLDA
jgi:outer membrane usher protein